MNNLARDRAADDADAQQRDDQHCQRYRQQRPRAAVSVRTIPASAIPATSEAST
jgi:hypothetical protein